MVNQAKVTRAENKKQIDESESQKAALEDDRNAAQSLKDEAEALEKEAQDLIEAKKEARALEKVSAYDDDTLAEIAFNHLDTNRNGELLQYEITKEKYLDPTPNTSFLNSEAKKLMNDKDKLTLEEFKTDLWPVIKDKMKPKLSTACDKYEQEKIDAARKEEEEAQAAIEAAKEIEEAENAPEEPEPEIQEEGKKIIWDAICRP